jgi:hypothetical protein
MELIFRPIYANFELLVEVFKGKTIDLTKCEVFLLNFSSLTVREGHAALQKFNRKNN